VRSSQVQKRRPRSAPDAGAVAGAGSRALADGTGEALTTLEEFFLEGAMDLDRIDREVIDLERRPDDREILDSLFRALHTIKGTAGFLGFATIESVSHDGETLLSEVRDGRRHLDPEFTTALLGVADTLRALLAAEILRFTGARTDIPSPNARQRLTHARSRLRRHLTGARRQPIGSIWNGLPRLVRDLAVRLGKQMRVEMAGSEIAVERWLLDAIKHPLLHMARNSVHHGIETPDVRRQRGKSPEGVLRMEAADQGRLITIQVSDDGAGIDPETVRAAAVRRGIVSEERAAAMSDGEAQDLIFLAGFSMADGVTTISGRGVGMDVVKNNVERVGGRIGLQSRVGEGTTLTINIPRVPDFRA
jgi:two-component system chemotaxis sensor kinase CheA